MARTQPPGQGYLGGLGDSEPSCRLLFLILPDAAAIVRLRQEIMRLVRENSMSGRPVDPDRLHMTVQISKDLSDQMPKTLISSTDRAAATLRMQPFEIVLDRVIGTKTSLILYPSRRSEELMKFQKALTVALRRSSFILKPKWAFSPHVTLSYDFSDVPKQEIKPIAWTIREFVFVESLIGKHEYIQMGRWQLGH